MLNLNFMVQDIITDHFCNRRHFVIRCRTTPVEVSLQSWERELSNAVDCMHVRCMVAELCMK